MNRKWILGMILIAVLVVPVATRAHEGHAHKVMGTVSAIDGNRVTVKTTDAKTVMVILDAKTRITQGKTKLDVKAVRVGTRIVAEGADVKGVLTAASIQVGTAPLPVAKK